ncbi:MAG: hypothetical protein L6Q54_06525 [Leptospiraceae bacterium]|nr:hypothetical protein [Leptospiraceae bacterium]MCK6380891.1 hypothetical protein [Leptospiraceae bacterium]NUM41466.1 hypothetical protein [Leptospiraceae bacterium]
MGRSAAAFNKLLNAMRKLSVEVNDEEICRRFETLMQTSKEDLNLNSVRSLLQNPVEFEPKEIPEPYTQYVRHFIYMVKRNEKSGNNKHFYSDGESSEKKRVLYPDSIKLVRTKSK